ATVATITHISTISVLGQDRYLISAIPCTALLTASVLHRFAGARPARFAILCSTIAVILAIGARAIFEIRPDPFREAVAKLRPLYRASDALIIAPADVREGFEFYVPQARVDLALANRSRR